MVMVWWWRAMVSSPSLNACRDNSGLMYKSIIQIRNAKRIFPHSPSSLDMYKTPGSKIYSTLLYSSSQLLSQRWKSRTNSFSPWFHILRTADARARAPRASGAIPDESGQPFLSDFLKVCLTYKWKDKIQIAKWISPREMSLSQMCSQMSRVPGTLEINGIRVAETELSRLNKTLET